MDETLQEGKYEILHEIGQGGMAIVFKGRDTALDREVAIKVLHPHLANRADSRMRLQREARAVAKLHHPNILEIYDYSGLDCPDSYIVTEYIRGETLKDFADRHTPSLPEVGAMIVHEVATALAHAHEHGIIHRDIKPENIMIRDDGTLKLMDFGIAQIVDMQAMTVTGALVGSPAHMSPEHVEGKPLDFRADVFSLGTLLYFLTTGRLPFDSPSPHALLRQILEAEYDDPRRNNPAIGRSLHRIISNCLAREPDDRYDSVERLQDDLLAYLKEVGLDEPAEELVPYFEDPQAAEAALTKRVVEQVLALAQHDAETGRVASALEHYNQVLSLHGDREDALAQVQRLTSARSRSGRLRLFGYASAAAAAVFLMVWAALPGGPAQAPEPNLARHAAVLPPVAVQPAKAPAPAVPGKSDSAAPAPEPAPRIVRDGMPDVLRADRRAIEAVATAPAAPRPEKAAVRAEPKRPRVQRPKTPPVKPAAPQPAAVAKGDRFSISARYGGYLEFDGTTYPYGHTGTLHKQPGRYTVTVAHDDATCCFKKTYGFTIPGKSKRTYSPGFHPATLIVTRAPPGAKVLVAQKPGRVGKPIHFKMSKPRAPYQVSVSATGFKSRTQTVTLTAGETTTVRMALSREETSAGP